MSQFVKTSYFSHAGTHSFKYKKVKSHSFPNNNNSNKKAVECCCSEQFGSRRPFSPFFFPPKEPHRPKSIVDLWLSTYNYILLSS